MAAQFKQLQLNWRVGVQEQAVWLVISAKLHGVKEEQMKAFLPVHGDQNYYARLIDRPFDKKK